MNRSFPGHLLLLVTTAVLAVIPTPAHAQVVYQRLRAFGFIEFSSTDPAGGLVEGTNGALYGLSQGGGQAEKGTVFRLNKDGSGFTILQSFSGTNGDGQYPAAGLLMATNRMLYGMTWAGGYSNLGTIFQIAQDGSSYRVLKSFTGVAPDAASPVCNLIQAGNGMVYGTSYAGGDYNLGTLFRINPDGSGYSVLKSFAGGANDGAKPRGALVQGTNGMLFGTTTLGGTNNQGTVFTLDLDGNGYQVLRSFTGALGDGAQPYAALVSSADGVLYGTTYNGGTANQGTIFQMFQDGSGYSVLKRFTSAMGTNPFAPLLLATNGLLYGAANGGGASSQGTIFQFDPISSAYKVLRSFAGYDGAQPEGALMQGSDGVLYGLSSAAGVGEQGPGTGQGTAFTIDLSGANFKVLWNFRGAGGDGINPEAPLVEATNGCLYSITQNGGTYGQGAVFRMNKDGTGYAVLRSFAGTNGNPALPDGARPAAGLVQGTDGALYGTTSVDYQLQVGNYGLAIGNGTIFKLNLDGSGYHVIKRFPGGAGGSNPYGRLIQATNGWLYGTTLYGGSAGDGIVFRLNLDGTIFTVLTNFSNSSGYESLAGLLQVSDGNLFGTTISGGAGGQGTVFKLNLDGTGLQVLNQFFGTNGAFASGPLLQGLDGALYGTTILGGGSNAGTVFRLNLNGSGFALVRSFTGANGDGKSASGGVVQASNGILYGTTSGGGVNPPGCGTLFQLNPDGTDYVVLRSFIQDFYDGILPSGLLQASDGLLYGTTSSGARDQYGTIYAFVPPAVILPPIPAETSQHISFLGISGWTYVVQQAPTPLGPWTSLGPAYVGNTGIGEIDDLNPPKAEGFYRTENVINLPLSR